MLENGFEGVTMPENHAKTFVTINTVKISRSANDFGEIPSGSDSIRHVGHRYWMTHC